MSEHRAVAPQQKGIAAISHPVAGYDTLQHIHIHHSLQYPDEFSFLMHTVDQAHNRHILIRDSIIQICEHRPTLLYKGLVPV